MKRKQEQPTGLCPPCVYCGSTEPPKKCEHVMPRLLGTFEQNWTLKCVCDGCNEYFSKNLELVLGRDSREALFRLDLGLKPAAGASELLQRRVKTSLLDGGLFGGMRMTLVPSADGREVIPIPEAQVGFRREGQPWEFFRERELTDESVLSFRDAQVEIRIHGVAEDCERLKAHLSKLGIEFAESGRALNQPIHGGNTMTVAHDIDVDRTIIRAACKIGFNYAAKVLGADIVRRPAFDAARRFVRFDEDPLRVASVRQTPVLSLPGAATPRVHACAVMWNSGCLIAGVSLFNEITYSLRLCEAAADEYPESFHAFDPLNRVITVPTLAS